eukprot:m.194638 g.194638  ORF g.194638 m.194638 type:complete len:306 (+) comp21793_c1_seq1:1593-2510(+)
MCSMVRPSASIVLAVRSCLGSAPRRRLPTKSGAGKQLLSLPLLLSLAELQRCAAAAAARSDGSPSSGCSDVVLRASTGIRSASMCACVCGECACIRKASPEVFKTTSMLLLALALLALTSALPTAPPQPVLSDVYSVGFFEMFTSQEANLTMEGRLYMDYTQGVGRVDVTGNQFIVSVFWNLQTNEAKAVQVSSDGKVVCHNQTQPAMPHPSQSSKYLKYSTTEDFYGRQCDKYTLSIPSSGSSPSFDGYLWLVAGTSDIAGQQLESKSSGSSFPSFSLFMTNWDFKASVPSSPSFFVPPACIPV